MVSEKMNYMLDTRFDARASFYGKATVYVFEDGSKLLKSYSTFVACITPDRRAYVEGMHSQTTLRHIKEFLKQDGFEAEDWKHIEKDYSMENYPDFDFQDFKLERGFH